MAEGKFEELDLQTEEKILSLNVKELTKLANELKLDEESIQGTSRRDLSKLVRKTIEQNVELCENVTGKVEYLNKLQNFLQIEQPQRKMRKLTTLEMWVEAKFSHNRNNS